MQVSTQFLRRVGNGVGIVIDVTVTYRPVDFCPAQPGRWQGEPADREPLLRSQYEFAFIGAEPDDPDEKPLTGPETLRIAAWFAQHHDDITEHAADQLRGEGL